MWTMNEDHMVYGSWDIRPDGQSFLSFWVIFCPLTLLITKKCKILKNNEEINRRCCHSTFVYHKWQSYGVWFLRHGAWQKEFFVILDYFLPFYSLNPENQNFEKMEKNAWRYLHFTYVYHKWKSYDVWFLR